MQVALTQYYMVTTLNMNYVKYISGYVDTSGLQFNINFFKQITFLGC